MRKAGIFLLIFFSGAGLFAQTRARHTLGGPKITSKQKAPLKSKGLSENFRLSYAVEVKKYVARSLDPKDKLFHFWDPEVEEEWTLELVKVHDEDLVPLGHDRYFAPVDFRQKDLTGEGEDTPLVLDVYGLRIPEGWEIEEIYIRSVNDRPRYTYDKEYNRIPTETKSKTEDGGEE